MPVGSVNYSKVCRLCLQPGENIVSIFSTENGDQHLGPQSLALKIQACVSIEIREGDRISTLICNKCKDKVSSWCKFKNVCDDSQTKLRDWLTINGSPNYNTYIKDEPIDHEEIERPGSPEANIFEPNVSIKEEINSNPIQISSISGRYGGTEQLISESTQDEDDSQPPVLEPQRHLLSSLGLAPRGAILQREYQRSQQNMHMNTEDLYPMDTAESMDSADDSLRNHLPKKRKRSKSNNPNCRVCGLKFANLGNARRHEKNVHKYFDDLQPNPMSPLIAKKFKAKSRIQNMDVDTNDSMSQMSQDETISQDSVSQDEIMSQEEETNSVDIVTLEEGTGMLTQDQLDFIGRNKDILDAVRGKICCCCNKQYSALKPLLSHMRKRYVVPSFQCYYCLISFDSRSSYCKHIGKHRCRDMYSVYKSLIANGTAITIAPAKSSLIKLTKHSKLETVNDVTPLRVQYNNISTKNDQTSKLPLKDALASKIFGCNFCEFRSRLKVDVKKHVVRQHPVDLTQDLLRCRYCAQDFENIELRKRHNNNADCTSHVICGICDSKFDNLPSFNDHASGSHATYTKSSDRSYITEYDAPTSCHLCPKSYATPHNLIRHLKTNHASGSSTYNCRFCNEAFRLKMLAKAHEKECPVAEPPGQKLPLPDSVNNSIKNEDVDCNFSCKVCGALFKTIELWTQHQDLHRRCTLCTEAFLTQNELDVHMKTHLKLKLYNCNLCNNTYSSATRLKEHLLSHSRNIADNSLHKWFCEICNIPFNNPLGYANHMKVHNEMPTLHPIENHNMDENTKQDIKNTNVQQHDTENETAVDEEIFECHICQKRVGSKQGLYRHVLYAHKVNIYKSPVKDERGYKCNSCDNYYATKHGMNRHKRNVHGTGDSMSKDTFLNPVAVIGSKKCDKCDYIAKSLDEIAEHKLYVHNTNAGSKLCSVCNEVLINAKALWYHKKKCHPELMRDKTVDCEICGEHFQNKAHLYRHIKTVHVPAETDVETQESQDEVTFSCTICNEVFYSSSSLYRHKKTHVKENISKNDNTKTPDAETLMHPCDICQKSFRTALGLDRHKVTHEPAAEEEGEEDLQCDLCPKKFTSTGALKSHRGWHLRAANGRTQDLENTDGGSWKPNSISPSRMAKMMRYSSLLPGEETLMDDEGESENVSNPTDDVVIIPISETQKPTDNKIIKAALEKAENTHCNLCNVTFKHVTLYRRHLMEVHRSIRSVPIGTLADSVIEDIKKMRCMTCNLTFKEKAEWIDHKVQHINDQVKSNKMEHWPCDCGKTFKRKDHLKSHFRTHMHIVSDTVSAPDTAVQQQIPSTATVTSPTFYTCNLCRLSFKSSKDLRAHVNSHTKEQIMLRQNFKCDFCGIITTDFKQYQDCRKMHHVPTKFKCNACKIYFANHETLIKHHQDQHTDLPLSECIKTTFNCTQCDKQYTMKHYLKKHMETAH